MSSQSVTRFFKGVAIFLIILCHSHQTFTLPGITNNTFSFLQIGVQMFMVLSSMGLCFSYSKKPLKWFDFMKKRFSKIMVMYWFAIALAVLYRVAFAFVMHKNIIGELNPFGIIINSLFLHGVYPNSIINNQIVRGGWFIGTIVLYYALFPYLYRLYFNTNKAWKKTRKYMFPTIAFLITVPLFYVFKCFDFSSAYKHFLIQFTPFALGFPLYELQTNNELKNLKFRTIKCGVFLIASLVLFLTNTFFKELYIICSGLAFFYLMVSVLNNKKFYEVIENNSICRFFNVLGDYSFSIYLTHSYIAFDFCYVVTTVLSRIYVNDLLWFILLQPIVIILSLLVSKIFDYVVNFVISKIKKAKSPDQV